MSEKKIQQLLKENHLTIKELATRNEMKVNNSKITEEKVNETSYWNKQLADEQVAKAMSFLTDDQKAIRQKAQNCKTCYYFRSGGIAGQAFTDWNCGICNAEESHSNTNTPKVCNGCAVKHELCVKCGGDVRLRVKRTGNIPK